MKIEIKNNIFLLSDGTSYSLARLTGLDKKGKETFQYLGHYSSLKGVIRGFVEYGVKNSNATTMKELVKTHDELVDHVEKLFEGA